MFKIGDYVSYRSEGVCKISDIRKENFGGGEGTTYYILAPVNDPKSTLFVPMDNERLIALMRPLLSANEISALCEELRSERMDWVEENRMRNNVFREILSEGDRRKLIVLLNTVTERMEAQVAAGKRILGTDLNAANRAAQLLLEEFSATAELSSAEELLALLKGEKTVCSK
ncbi:MAG: CarD family transcriptional regulator [Clostridia bacterium]|nr:CarD family transcriptional regulator [Clostridia bacterium]